MLTQCFGNEGVELLTEPEAALRYHLWAKTIPPLRADKHVLVVDFGAGTTDFTLRRLDDEGKRLVDPKTYGERYGGGDFDVALATHIAQDLKIPLDGDLPLALKQQGKQLKEQFSEALAQGQTECTTLVSLATEGRIHSGVVALSQETFESSQVAGRLLREFEQVLKRALAHFGVGNDSVGDGLVDFTDARLVELAGRLNTEVGNLQDLYAIRGEFDEIRQQLQYLRQNPYVAAGLVDASGALVELYGKMAGLRELVQALSDRMDWLRDGWETPVLPEPIVPAPEVPPPFEPEVPEDPLYPVDEAVQVLARIPELRPEVWAGLQPEQKLEVLQHVENRLAEVQGRPACQVVPEAMNPGCRGFFDGQVIHVNMESLAYGSNVADAVNTVAHEGRHAFQHFAIRNPWILPDPGLAQVWRNNLSNYMPAEQYGFELYRSQPVETDVWHWGDTIERELYRA